MIRISNNRQVADTNAYKNFAAEFDFNIEFLKNLSDLISYNGRIISFIGAQNMYYLNTELLDSGIRTLESIRLTCSIGAFSDANSLIRKLRDDVLLYIYILDVIKKRKAFNENDFSINSMLTNDEIAVEAWLSGKVDSLKWELKKKLGFENYMDYLKKDHSLNEILTTYNLNTYWQILRGKLNDYVHNNGRQYTAHNTVEYDNDSLDIFLKNVNTRTSYITSFFFVLLTMVDSALLMSSDTIDHLDIGMEAPEGSQYLIAPFIQEYIDKKVILLNPELKKYLKENNGYGMNID